MELQLGLGLGLALPRNSTQEFDLNSNANEAAAVNHDQHHDDSLSSTCTSDRYAYVSDDTYKKRGFGRGYQNQNGDDHRGFDCQSGLPFLSLTPHHSDGDDNFPQGYGDNRDVYSSNIKGSYSMFVKVKMEGVGIARKVDLSLYHSVEKLKETLMAMFGKWHENPDCYRLTYQDMEGDWLLAEDVPWRSFIQSVQRLELVKNVDGMI